MPKFAQTLTASTYNETDIATSIKTGFDNLGWGTGKVDIQGGYRFTATEQTNTATTPKVVNSADFLDNYIGSKNIVNPHLDVRFLSGSYLLSMYLPGIKSYRIKFTIVSSTLPDGAAVAWDNATKLLRAYYFSNRTDKIGTVDSTTYLEEIWTMPTSMTVGTQYTTPWTTGDITAYPTVLIRNAGLGTFSIKIDAVEYTVNQNKFAVQSPNLDSPTFEIYSTKYSGNHYTSMVTYPIKNAKVPLVKLTQTNNIGSSSSVGNLSTSRAGIMQEYVRALFNTNPETSTIGVCPQLAHIETLISGTFGTDTVIRIGSNNTFDGFYINIKNNVTYGGTVWDTFDKSKSFPINSPQYPPQRLTTVQNYGWSDSVVDSSIQSTGQDTKVVLLYKVQNQTTLEGLNFEGLFGGSSNTPPYSGNVVIGVSEVSLNPDGTFTVTKVLQNPTFYNVTVTPHRMYVPLTTPVTASAGYIAVSLSTNFQKPQYFTETSLDNSIKATKSRNLIYVGHALHSEPGPSTNTVNGIRYVRDWLSGSTANNGAHWIELQVFAGSTNLTAGRIPTTNFLENPAEPFSRLTDGVTTSTSYISPNITYNLPYPAFYVQLDLGSVRTDVTSIKAWHFFSDSRVYNHALEVSEDGLNWVAVFDSNIRGGYVESSAGRTTNISLPVTGKKSSIDLITNATTVGGKINLPGIHNGGGNRAIPELRVALVEVGSPTPSSAISSYAENWFTFGKVGVFGPGSNYLNKVVSPPTLANNNPLQYHHMIMAKPSFGMDLQMVNVASNGEFFSMPQPGSWFLDSYVNFSANLSTIQRLEFGPSVPTVGGRAYYQAWFTNRNGSSFLSNNIFIVMNQPSDLNTSFVTEDGTEYVAVIMSSTGGYNHFAFRLTP